MNLQSRVEDFPSLGLDFHSCVLLANVLLANSIPVCGQSKGLDLS